MKALVPTVAEVNGLAEGMLAPDAFGMLGRVVKITDRGKTANGAPFVAYELRFTKERTMTGMMTGGEPHWFACSFFGVDPDELAARIDSGELGSVSLFQFIHERTLT